MGETSTLKSYQMGAKGGRWIIPSFMQLSHSESCCILQEVKYLIDT